MKEEELKNELKQLSTNALQEIKNLCGDDFRLWDICTEILKERKAE